MIGILIQRVGTLAVFGIYYTDRDAHVESRGVDVPFTNQLSLGNVRRLAFQRNTDMCDSPVIQILAKAPVAGLAKTRLIPLLGAEGAARLQSAMIAHTLGTCREIPSVRIELWCSPDTSHPLFQESAERYGALLMIQRGDDLGKRMHRALANALQRRGAAAVLIGTDVPTLATTDLKAAFSALHGGHDAVIAPALDGGYVLIGLNRASPTLFRSIAWGSSKVLADTRQRLNLLGYRWRELAAHRDIDRPEDWLWLTRTCPSLAQKLATDTMVVESVRDR